MMKEAVKKVILQEVYYKGVMQKGEPANPLKNYTLAMVSKKGQFTDEQVGADLRATWEGINMVESGFQVIEKFKEEPVPSPYAKENPAV
jgi:hypothetical protein